MSYGVTLKQVLMRKIFVIHTKKKNSSRLFMENKKKQEGHDGPGSLTWVIFPTNESLFLWFQLVTPGVRPVLIPRGIWMKLRKVYKEMLHNKIKALSHPVSEKKNFEVGLLCSYVPTCDPRVGVSFDPKGIIWVKLIKVHKEILNTKNQSSNPSSLREEEFWSWFSLFLCSNLWPPGLGQFWLHKHHMNKLGRGP